MYGHGIHFISSIQRTDVDLGLVHLRKYVQNLYLFLLFVHFVIFVYFIVLCCLLMCLVPSNSPILVHHLSSMIDYLR